MQGCRSWKLFSFVYLQQLLVSSAEPEGKESETALIQQMLVKRVEGPMIQDYVAPLSEKTSSPGPSLTTLEGTADSSWSTL